VGGTEDNQRKPMNAMIVENVISWFLFALASTCTLSFASTVYDRLVNLKRRDRNKRASTGMVSLPPSQANPLSGENPVIRGYDTPELFREDLWIRRIEHSRKVHAVQLASMRQVKSHPETAEGYLKRLCEIFAQQAQPGRNN
jgi:hypothetical protein